MFFDEKVIMRQMKNLQFKKGFTLVEIMVVVSIIATLAAIALPGFLRARKRSQSSKILNDLRMLDSALDQYAIETGRIAGFTPVFADLKRYLKPGTTLFNTGGDLFGNTYTIPSVDTVLALPHSTFLIVSDVAPFEYWSPYSAQ